MSNPLQSRRALYVSGLVDSASASTLRAAFIPFGPIQSIELPQDYAKGTHKGFAFVEFKDPDDAAEAIDNMDGAELFGKTLTVSLAQPNQMTQGSGSRQQAIWSTDEWFQQHVAGGTSEADKERQQQKELEQNQLEAHLSSNVQQ